jgi:hypothetical protein
LIGEHGGRFEQYPAPEVTHVVAMNLAQCKMKELEKKKVLLSYSLLVACDGLPPGDPAYVDIRLDQGRAAAS